MEDDLLSGNGSTADFVNAYGDNYVYNQTGFDVIDNGAVTKGNGTATVSSPSWTDSLSNIFGLATQGAGLVNTLTGKTTAPASTVAQPSAGTAASSSKSSTSSSWFVGIALAIGAALGLFLMFRRR